MNQTLRNRIEHFHLKALYLRIVLQNPGSDNRVLQAFEKIVEISSPPVRRVAFENKMSRPGKLLAKPSEAADNHHSVLASLPANEHPRPYVAIIPIKTRRPRKVKGYLLHGGTSDPACAAGAAAEAAATPPFFS